MSEQCIPHRIVCLTEETTETLYLLGEGDRVVGISGYTVRPPEARQKPKVSSFLHARYEKIEALKPDLILAFSDLQADITERAGQARLSGVHLQPAQRRRDPADDSRARRHRRRPEQGRGAGARVERASSASAATAARFRDGRASTSRSGTTRSSRGIRWVEELVEIAGGEPVFPELRHAAAGQGSHRHQRAGDRRGARRDHRFVVRQAGAQGTDRGPARLGWHPGRAGRQIYEVKSTYILQPARRR